MNNYTVTELNDTIKKALRSEFKGKMVTITGEISNLKHSSVHTFLTLKDDNNAVSVAFWNKSLKNKHGDHVEITGRVDYYAKSGSISIMGNTIDIVGVGALHKEYEKLRDQYEKKGYFKNKKSLPKNVKNIGVITSAGGAALQDFLYVLEKNNFSGDVHVYDCSVQGNRCPTTVAAGIKFFNSTFYVNYKNQGKKKRVLSHISNNNSDDDNDDNDDNNTNDTNDTDNTNNNDQDEDEDEDNNEEDNETEDSEEPTEDTEEDKNDIDVDIIVITRGGGSFEDLMGFSHPKVIEAIHNSNKYTISAVGHEIDNMLSDYVANYRAPTPSIAGEVISSIVVKKNKKITDIENNIVNTKHEILQLLHKYKRNLRKIYDSLDDPTKVLNVKLDSIHNNASNHIRNKLYHYSKKLNAIKDILTANNATEMLNNGFIVLTDVDGDIITTIDKILNNPVTLIHSTGRYKVMITDIQD